MFLDIPNGIWAIILLIASIWVVQKLAKVGKAEMERQSKVYKDKLDKIPNTILSVSGISMTWRKTNINFHLPLIQPFEVKFDDVKRGDFSETKWLLIGTEKVDVYNHDFEAKGKFKPALHVAIAEVEINRNGSVMVKVVPMGEDEISNIHLNVKLHKIPTGTYRTTEEMYYAAR